MSKTALLAATAVLALSAGAASAAPLATSAGTGVVAHRLFAPSNLTTLYSQNDNDGGVGLVSQMFGTSFPTYSAQGADDFAIPANTKWKIKEVDVTGVYFNGSGPATSENVYFYKDAHGLPGKLINTFSNVVGAANGGSFAIKLPSAQKLKGGTAGKTYWVSVQANMAFNSGGEWGWEDRSVQNGNPAAWQNPGGGFGVCQTWGTLQNCLGYGPDFMWALKGK